MWHLWLLVRAKQVVTWKLQQHMFLHVFCFTCVSSIILTLFAIWANATAMLAYSSLITTVRWLGTSVIFSGRNYSSQTLSYSTHFIYLPICTFTKHYRQRDKSYGPSNAEILEVDDKQLNSVRKGLQDCMQFYQSLLDRSRREKGWSC